MFGTWFSKPKGESKPKPKREPGPYHNYACCAKCGHIEKGERVFWTCPACGRRGSDACWHDLMLRIGSDGELEVSPHNAKEVRQWANVLAARNLPTETPLRELIELQTKVLEHLPAGFSVDIADGRVVVSRK